MPLAPPTADQGPLRVIAAREAAFRRTARRYSLCHDDAEDAYQRAVEILLTKAPDAAPGHLEAWMQVVTRREALALRRARERISGSVPVGDHPPPAEGDPLDRIPADVPGPSERLERRERAIAQLRALAALKPHERRALVLQARGYSYAEICAICGWTYTKLNRSLSEGRARLREMGVYGKLSA